jgi:A-factor type gamma-butyrolactone 1'-reductase (1S-forming)
LWTKTEENFESRLRRERKTLFLLLQQEVKQIMKQGQGGSIVNAASVSGLLAIQLPAIT